MELSVLHHAIEQSWSADTAFGEWNIDNPSGGQCVVTALIVQDYFGGNLLRCPLNNEGSHYWNRLPNGEEIDLTKDQFNDHYFPLRKQQILRDRENVLLGVDTKYRYALLRQRVNNILGEIQKIDENII